MRTYARWLPTSWPGGPTQLDLDLVLLEVARDLNDEPRFRWRFTARVPGGVFLDRKASQRHYPAVDRAQEAAETWLERRLLRAVKQLRKAQARRHVASGRRA